MDTFFDRKQLYVAGILLAIFELSIVVVRALGR